MVEHAEGRRIAETIDAARRRQVPKVSQRSAAVQAGISEGWWRQLVAGEQKRGAASFPVVGSPETYLAMARAVGVESEVAAMLGHELPPSDRPGQSVMTIDAIRNDPHLLPEARQHLLNQYQLLLRIRTAAGAVTDQQPPPEPPSEMDALHAGSRAKHDRRRTSVRGQQRPGAKEQERGTGTHGDD